MSTGLVVRLFLFLLLELLGLQIFSTLFYELFGYMAAGAFGALSAALVANGMALRIFERRPFLDVGFRWSPASQRNLALGLGAGAAAALVASLAPAVGGGVQWVAVQEAGAGFRLDRVAFLFVILAFGALGEELFFRGYGYQVLMGRLGPWLGNFAFAGLFAYAHSTNLGIAGIEQNVLLARLALFNTFAWGLLLGYAVWHAQDLWLATGLHFGWNVILPLTGVPVSGFTMKVTGYEARFAAGEWWTGGAYGPEASVLTTVVVVALGLALGRMPVTRQRLALVETKKEQTA